MKFHLRDLENGMERMSTVVTAEAIYQNATWPFVTVPAFEVLGESVRTQTGLEIILLCPLVTAENVEAWQTYSVREGPIWLAESRAASISGAARARSFGDAASLLATDYIVGNPAPVLLDLTSSLQDMSRGADLGFVPSVQNRPGGPFIPVWMQTPTPFTAQLINVDFLSAGFKVIPGLISAVMATRRALVLGVSDISSIASLSIKFEDHEKYHHSLVNYTSANTNSTFQNPHAPYVYPVFEKVHDRNSKIVAFLSALLPFDRYLINLLPKGVHGIDAVLRNCRQNFTYRLDGNSVSLKLLQILANDKQIIFINLPFLLCQAFYIGEFDLHDPNYDATERIIPFYTYTDETINDVPKHCPYTFSIYSSSAFESTYKSNTPWVTTLAVTCTFVIMALTVLSYDCFVRQRNNRFLGFAARTGAILSSLFPSSVRDQVIEHHLHDGKQLLVNGSQNEASPEMKEIKTNNKAEDDDLSARCSLLQSRPIANFFADTTVLFADIAGFTAWSSNREPEQVFALLETIYKAFDTIAISLGVYKIETIGDCYVAVTGVPEPQPWHAVIMASFARECMFQMQKLMGKLVSRLGPETLSLSMRFGLHSGSVTAGVLRGDRARFQLFGETVRIANRVESTGQRDCIHISEETARFLEKAGKGSWLTPRSDLVDLGTGAERRTYWVEVKKAQKAKSDTNKSDTSTMTTSTFNQELQ
jgi:class 3 adenylate cyclase